MCKNCIIDFRIKNMQGIFGLGRKFTYTITEAAFIDAVQYFGETIHEISWMLVVHYVMRIQDKKFKYVKSSQIKSNLVWFSSF